ncbi:hypothetical protein CPB83DRAFT_895527 [Crepidotus variabilis]|uniref:Uncharacterized protein n=1 Tax=Crepidotus variabilis TaxID=179855 RepID=A0A9P6ECV2_9AGAR|nr:hypothetical protein CPB83DRAFT_895527 [Crepidotus variabilis]
MSTVELGSTCLGGTSKAQPSSLPLPPAMGAPRTFFPNSSTVSWRPNHGTYSAPNTPTTLAFVVENEQHPANPPPTLREPGLPTLRPLSEGRNNDQASKNHPRSQSTPGREGLFSKLKKQLSKSNTRAAANTSPKTQDTQPSAEWNSGPSRPVVTLSDTSPSSSTSSSPTIPLFADPTASGSSIFVMEDPVMPFVVQGVSLSRPVVASSSPSPARSSSQQSSNANVRRSSLAISEISQSLSAVPNYPPPVPPSEEDYTKSENYPDKNEKKDKGKKKHRKGRPGSLKSGVTFWSSEESSASSPSSYSCESAMRQRFDTEDKVAGNVGMAKREVEKRKSLRSLKGSPSLQSGVSIIGSSKSFFDSLEARRSSLGKDSSDGSVVVLGGKTEEQSIYAPFVPLIFQHERTQTRSKTNLPLASFEANPEAKSIKSVRVGPHPPSGRHVPFRSKSMTDAESTNSEAASSDRPRSRKEGRRLSPIPPLPATSPSQTSLSQIETTTTSSGSGGSSSTSRRKQRHIPPPLHPAPKGALPPSPLSSSSEVLILEPQSASYSPSSPTGTATSTSTSSDGTKSPVTPSSPLFGVSASSPPDGVNLRISLSSPEEATTGDEMGLFGLRNAAKRIRTVKSKTSGNLKESRDEAKQRGRARSTAQSDAYDSTGGMGLQAPFSQSLNVQFAEPLSGRHSNSVSRSPSRARSGTSEIPPRPSSSPGRSILSSRPSRINMHGELVSSPTSPPPSGPLPSTPGESKLHISNGDSQPRTLMSRISREFPAHRHPSPFPDEFTPLGLSPNSSTLPSANASPAPSPVPRVREWKDIDLGLISSDSASETENIPPSPSGVIPMEYLHLNRKSPTVEDEHFDDIDDAASHISRAYSYSQSIESHSNDPEYEALLAANTLANANVSGMPIRNLGVGRRTVASEAGLTARGAEWTLFLGNEQKERTGGLALPLALRGRTKSESALKASGAEDVKAPKHRTGRSGSISNGVPQSLRSKISALTNTAKSTKTPKAEVLRPTSMIPSDDWTLSLPLRLPGAKSSRKAASSSGDSKQIPADHLESLGSKGHNSVATKLRAEVIVLVEGVEIESEENGFFDEIEADGFSSAGHEVDTEESTSANDHDSHQSAPRLSYASGHRPISHIVLPVPRVVSSGSGLENASHTMEENPRKWKGRKLSDGMDSIINAAGDAESGLWDSSSMRTTETLTEEDESQENVGMSEDGQVDETFPVSEPSNGAYNLARLDALSADLRKFNDLLRDGAGTMKTQSSATYLGASPNRMSNLKHTKSCGMLPHDLETSSSLPFTTEENSTYQKLQEAASLERSRSTTVNVQEMRGSADLSPRVSISSQTMINPNTTSSPPSARCRVSLPYAPGSSNPILHSSSKPAGRTTSLSISSNMSADVTCTHPPPSAFGRTLGRTLSLTSSVTSTAPRSILPSTTTSNILLASMVPDEVVGSGLRVGGNGRVISLKKPTSSTQSKAVLLPPLKIAAPSLPAVEPAQDADQSEHETDIQRGQEVVVETKSTSAASSPSSAQTFYTSFSSQSKRPLSPSSTWSNGNSEETTSTQTLSEVAANLRSSSSTPTPTATSPPVLTLCTSPSIHDHQGVYPSENDLYTPTYDTPTPLASSFPTPPPFPPTFEDNLSIFQDSRWSTYSLISQRTATPSPGISSERPSLSEVDNDSLWSGSFHSARSSFET